MIVGLLALVLAWVDTTSRVALTPGDSVSLVELVPVSVVTPVVAPAPEPRPVALSWRPMSMPMPLQLTDTVPRQKRPLVAYSDWYGRRLTIHRTLSWAMLPLFGISYYTGTRLATDGRSNSPYWVRAAHPWVATADVAVFGINTVTGVWNLWDARHDPEGRTKRIMHSALFMLANAGFAYAGSMGEEARNDAEIRNRHRDIATISMGVSTLGWMIMLIGK